MQAIHHMSVSAKFYAQPPSKDFMQSSKLYQVIRKASEKVVAPHDLKPVKLAALDPKDRLGIAWDVRGSWLSIGTRQVALGVPNLQQYLTT